MADLSQVSIDGITYDFKDTMARNLLSAAIGSPLRAFSVSDMNDASKIYVYVGNESGYINGNWYYNDGNSWVSGGVYNSIALATDKTLSIENAAADSKYVGKAVNALTQYGSPFGLVDIITGYQTDSYRGISITKDNSYINIDGTATGNTRFKITYNLAHAVSVQTSWKEERLDVFNGKKYRLCVTPIGGSITTSSSLSVYLINSSGSATGYALFGNSTEGLFNSICYSNEFIANNNNLACMTINFSTGDAANNVRLKINFIDIANLKSYMQLASDE